MEAVVEVMEMLKEAVGGGGSGGRYVRDVERGGWRRRWNEVDGVLDGRSWKFWREEDVVRTKT